MMCEACMGLVVQIVTGFNRMILSGVGDRMMQKMSLYVQSYDYIEMCDGM